MEPKFDKNYHTHTFRCKHATGDVPDYCQAAIEQGLTVLGMSDHTPLPDNRWLNVRMEFSELDSYIQAIDQARDDFPELTILKGMECEYDLQYVSYYQEKLLDELKFDYLIGAAHYFPYEGEWKGSYKGPYGAGALKAYADYFIKSMESGLFTFMAHPDLIGFFYLTWDENTIAAAKDMFQAAKGLKIPLEINASGFRKPLIDTPVGQRFMYPWLPFWELASDYDLEVVVNADAHRPSDLTGKVFDAIEIAKKYDLKFADLSYLERK